jgi:hypothetical protein
MSTLGLKLLQQQCTMPILEEPLFLFLLVYVHTQKKGLMDRVRSTSIGSKMPRTKKALFEIIAGTLAIFEQGVL